MQIADIIMLALVSIMTVWGMVRGIVRQVGDLAALILGIVCSNLWGGMLVIRLLEYTDWSMIVCQFIAYLAIFLVVYLGVCIIAGCIQSLTQLVRLGWIDSILGGLFGAFKTILFVSLILNIAMFVFEDADVWKSPELTQSVCYETVRSFAPQVLHYIYEQETTPQP